MSLLRMLGYAITNRLAVATLSVESNILVERFTGFDPLALDGASRRSLDETLREWFVQRTNGTLTAEEAAVLKLLVLACAPGAPKQQLLRGLQRILDAFPEAVRPEIQLDVLAVFPVSAPIAHAAPHAEEARQAVLPSLASAAPAITSAHVTAADAGVTARAHPAPLPLARPGESGRPYRIIKTRSARTTGEDEPRTPPATNPADLQIIWACGKGDSPITSAEETEILLWSLQRAFQAAPIPAPPPRGALVRAQVQKRGAALNCNAASLLEDCGSSPGRGGNATNCRSSTCRTGTTAASWVQPLPSTRHMVKGVRS